MALMYNNFKKYDKVIEILEIIRKFLKEKNKTYSIEF